MSEANPEVPAAEQPAAPETPSVAEQPGEPEQPLTQEKVNALLAEQKRKLTEKFSGFDDLKAKAEKFDEAQEASKTEQQRAAEAATRAERERDEARTESLRYKAAATHGVSPDNFDLLGAGTEEEITARAERVGGLLQATTDLTQAQAEIERLTVENEALRTGKPIPASGRPVAQLRPGAAPPPPPEVPDDGYPAEWLSPSQRASVERARGVTTT